MQRYLMDFSTQAQACYQADCLIVGSGVAGLTTAWHAATAGLDVILAVKDTLTDSNTNKAQGGIAAVFGEDDTFSLHVDDTLVAGAGLCDEAVVRLTVEEGKREVEHLISLGAAFDRMSDGNLSLGREGCHSRSRIVHAQGDATGAEVVRSLLATLSDFPNVTVLEHTYAVDLLTHENSCYGVVAINTSTDELLTIRSGAVVLATGGTGRLFLHTTNPEGATGNGIAMAYRAGAELMDMEFVQFHPTSLVLPGVPNFLISEAVRGAGGILRNAKGERFMPSYHAMAELAPRDIVARAIFNEMQLAGTDSVFLAVSHIGEAEIKRHFPMITATCQSYGLDILKEMIPVAPAAHYMMGGIKVDLWGESSVKGLFACGEAACTGLHGANRLASNSLLEGLAFGKRIAAKIAEQSADIAADLQWEHRAAVPESIDSAAGIAELREMMNQRLGLIRNDADLKAALSFLAKRQEAMAGTAVRTAADLEYCNMLCVCRLITEAALQRTESRGGHYRSDYPKALPNWRRHIIQKVGENNAI